MGEREEEKEMGESECRERETGGESGERGRKSEGRERVEI